ncbi:MerR family transcriptional regulator [Streptomyces radicis]|uniref:MerR family transcriptional regulator n=1 Tax=Streptomyces radicis TaxID=1750517 RepID=A0A3A9VSG1_9ACTN|nr:MerR family transcriptional regulator [Streptomyces radicis]RKN03828.1 MerR family transcriptional regulator [Streptomyces radicis]RKN13933.1 MerR family transcriptional regulator [Streptomyces radicis]
MAATEKRVDRPPLTIQEVSRRSGLSEPTLRYYEKIGLIPRVDRDESSGHRRYDAATVETIEALACLRATGMSVRDMRAYLRHLGGGPGAAAELHDLFRRNVERVDEEIRRLRARQRYLRLKADLWAARRRSDAEAERRATDELIHGADALR